MDSVCAAADRVLANRIRNEVTLVKQDGDEMSASLF